MPINPPPPVPVAQRPGEVSDDAILRVFRVPPECAGMRLDVFMHAQLRNTSRTRARAIIENSAYDLVGRKRRPSDRLRGEDYVALWRPAFEVEVEVAPLQVLYEDPDLLAIDKPPLMTVHPTARCFNNTVIKHLEAQRPGEFIRLLHRLDRETSGVLLVARNPAADRAFKRLIEDRSLKTRAPAGPLGDEAALESREISKIYLTITWGIPQSQTIDLPLEPDLDNSLRVKMRIARAHHGVNARTDIEVLETRANYALVRCVLHTGRQHQIRVHLASLGCPVVGDKLYGPDDRMLARAADGELSAADEARLELPRHALHAHAYGLQHPMKGEWVEIRSPLAADLQNFWDGLALR